MCLSSFNVYSTEDPKPEPDDPLNNNMDFDKAPPACDQSTQTEEVVALSKKPPEVDTTNEEGEFNPSQDETDVWNKNFLLTLFFIDHVFVFLALSCDSS